MKHGLIFAIVWGFIIGIVLTAATDLTISDGMWWFWMLVLNAFGNFVIAPAIIEKENL